MIYVLDVVVGSYDTPEELQRAVIGLTNGLSVGWGADAVAAETDLAAGVLQFEFVRRPLSHELLDWLAWKLGGKLLLADLREKNHAEVLFHYGKDEP